MPPAPYSDVAPPAATAGVAPLVPRESRVTTILLNGRMAVAGVDYLCCVRNLSRRGMLVESDARAAVDDAVTIELRNMNVVTARVRWCDGNRFGLHLDDDQDVASLLRPPSARERHRPRSPRLTAACAVALWERGRPVAATLRDLSQTGCRIAVAQGLSVGSELGIAIPGFGSRRATVRWRSAEEAGLSFAEPLPFVAFAAWQRDVAARFG